MNSFAPQLSDPYARYYPDPCQWSNYLLPQYDYTTTMAPLDTAPPSLPPPATPSDITQSIRNASARAASSRTSKHEGGGPRPREKKHGCWMCEKSFDRPSTLRKVRIQPRLKSPAPDLTPHHPAPPRPHRRERSVYPPPARSFSLSDLPHLAFVCDTCGRRFGVASNLNRHVKRCILKPVNAANRTQMPPSTPPSGTTDAPLRIPPTADPVIAAAATTPAPSRKRTRDTTDPASPPPSPAHSPSKPPTKRRRRAPSPSHWIPHSLADFNITPAEYTKPTPVPLPPVTAYKDPASDEWIEERNSWDESVGSSPYHPCGWKGTLPGPGVGLGGKDVMNLGLVNGGTYVMGRLVMV